MSMENPIQTDISFEHSVRYKFVTKYKTLYNFESEIFLTLIVFEIVKITTEFSLGGALSYLIVQRIAI